MQSFCKKGPAKDYGLMVGFEMRILEIMPDFNLAGAEIMVENLAYYFAKNNIVKVISMYKCDTAITKRM